jgi:hypothetical protein
MQRWSSASMLCGLLVFTLSATTAAQDRVADAWEVLGPTYIGRPLDEVSNHISLICDGGTVRQVCATDASAMVSLGGVTARTIQAMFDHARLSKVTVIFSDLQYPTLLRFLTDRFGDGEDRSYVARAGMAGEFSAGVYVWRQAEVSVVLEQYAGKIDRAALSYGSESAMAEVVRKVTSYPRGARRDL